jgi:hypothetical protein
MPNIFQVAALADPAPILPPAAAAPAVKLHATAAIQHKEAVKTKRRLIFVTSHNYHLSDSAAIKCAGVDLV